MKTILFDIDGTILNCHSAGKAALLTATEEIFGSTGDMEELNFQGKTDPLILYESLQVMGLKKEEISRSLPDLKKRYFSLLEENLKTYPVKLMPGITELLEVLKHREDLLIGLLTGNFSTSAYMKVGIHSLEEYFPFGIFGDDTAVRNEMPGIGREKIKEKYNLHIQFSDMYIIGDTEYDIACAQYAGAVSIAVGTGWTEEDKLRSKNPDYYFDNLENTEEIVNIFK